MIDFTTLKHKQKLLDISCPFCRKENVVFEKDQALVAGGDAQCQDCGAIVSISLFLELCDELTKAHAIIERVKNWQSVPDRWETEKMAAEFTKEYGY